MKDRPKEEAGVFWKNRGHRRGSRGKRQKLTESLLQKNESFVAY